jgi:hypothetical protein
MLSDREYAKVALTHPGWQWNAVSKRVLKGLDREEMEELLARDLDVYDCVAESVRKWEGNIDGRIGKRRVEPGSAGHRRFSGMEVLRVGGW